MLQFAESIDLRGYYRCQDAENAAGMTAMQTATDNAKKVINDLTIQYNQSILWRDYTRNYRNRSRS